MSCTLTGKSLIELQSNVANAFLYSFSLQTADNFRPYLTSFQGNSFTDYINAVFVDVSHQNELHIPHRLNWSYYVLLF